MEKINHNVLIYINKRLSHWANWFVHHGDFGLGFPHKSLEGRLIDNGGILTHSTIRYIPSNGMAEETENLIKELAEQNTKLADALREYYFGTGNMVYKARRIGMSPSHFKVHVDTAKYWLIGRLSSQKPWTKYENPRAM